MIDSDRAFNAKLDAQAAEQEALHRKALDEAKRKHDEVRRSAEAAHERYVLAITQEKARREEEERVALQDLRRQAEEHEIAKKQMLLKEASEQEDARKRMAQIEADLQRVKQQSEENQQREAREAAERKSRDAQAEADRKSKEEAERQRQAQEAANSEPPPEQQPKSNNMTTQTQPTQPARQPSQPQPSQPTAQAPQGTTTATASLVSSAAEREANHERYLDLHKRLKSMRTETTAQCKTIPQLKDPKGQFLLSEWRRSIAQACGTLAKGTPKGNSVAMRKAVDILENAAKFEGAPMIDMSSIIISAHPPVHGQGSAILVFLLNHFAKSIVGRMIEEASRDPEMAEPLGIMVVTVFARPTLSFQGHSLIDLLWAKYHRVCPILFGIWGDERTQIGRTRLGWWKEGDKFITADSHYDRNSGLAIGFSAITLRNFSKQRTDNPAPNNVFWTALARLTNALDAELQPTHFYVIRSMLRLHIPRFMQLYGKAGMAAIRHALVAFPARGKNNGIEAANMLTAQSVLLSQELHLPL